MRFAILLTLASAAALAQLRPHPMEDASKDNLPSQKLGIDDLVAVSVYDAPELTRTVRVEADGAIHLPLLKDGVAAAGLFAHDVEASLVEALKSEEILVDPVVKVTVAEYHSRPISVMGAVRKPLTFQAVGTVTLLDALARAEGLSPDAGTEVLVSRPQPSPDSRGEVSATLLERIPLNRLLKDADPAVNYPLHGGEEVRVPEAGKIFVLGNVKKPGAFPVHDAGDNSILKMVALAEGVMPYAAKQAYIYRRDAGGDKHEIPVELDKILQRKAPDVALQVDDVLYIPDNRARRNAVNIIDRITSFGASTASGVLIWHQ
ncbi:MAG TPA: polysaccharide biosynthesis/export family protein [Bryobacteraceae bacterium]|jgi:polysaccharide biosynthesis/export protein|nr:polysaccharide biosynthesis/export family protein [Bryobacteraceae bacterium]